MKTVACLLLVACCGLTLTNEVPVADTRMLGLNMGGAGMFFDNPFGFPYSYMAPSGLGFHTGLYGARPHPNFGGVYGGNVGYGAGYGGGYPGGYYNGGGMQAAGMNAAVQGYNCGSLCGVMLRACRWACQPDPYQYRCTACMGARWDTCRGCMMYPSLGGVFTQN